MQKKIKTSTFIRVAITTGVLLAQFVSPNAHAEMPKALNNLTLEQAVKLALENSPNQKVSLKTAAVAESQYQEALSARWPTVSISASVMRMDQDLTYTFPATSISVGEITTPINGALQGFGVTVPNTITVPEQKLKIMDRDTATASLKVMLPLYTGGKITSIINQADLNRQISQIEYQRTSLQVVRDVKRYYYASMLMQNLVDIADDAASSMEVTRDFTKSLYEGGSEKINKLDYLKTEMALSYVNTLKADFQSKEESAKAALVYAMGLPTDTTVSLASKEFPSVKKNANLSALITQAKQFNPDIGVLKLAVRATEEKIKEARSAYFPQIALTGDIRHINNSALDSENRNSWTIGVGMEWQVFDFGKTSNRVNTAKYENEAMQARNVMVDHGVAAQIKNLFINLEAANKQVDLNEKSVDFSKQNENLTERAYQIGASKAEDMIQANILNALARGNLLRAQHDASYAVTELEYFLGSEMKF